VISSQRPQESGAEGQRVAASAFVTSTAMLAAMATGGLLAIVVLLKFGKNAETDGFFAAYGVYAVLLALAQSLRASAVAKLLEGTSVFESLDRLLGAALIVILATGVLLVGLGNPIADLLTGNLGSDAQGTARTALALLWPAAGAQLVAALAASALGTRGDFALPGFSFVAGGVLAIVLVVTIGGAVGIDSVSIGLAAGSFLTVLLMLWRMARFGYRPSRARLMEGRRAIGTLALVLAGSAGSIGLQISYVASLAFAARTGEGAVTLYSYAFFAASLLMGAVVGPAAIVLAAPLSRTWDRRPESLRPHLLAVFRAALSLVAPVVAVAALVGDELIELVLGSSLNAADADQVVTTFLALGGMIAATLALPVPALAAFARSRYLGVAIVTLVALGVHVVASAIAIDLDGLEALGGAASFGSIFSLVLMLQLVYGWALMEPIGLLLREVARVLLAIAVAFGPPGIVSAVLGGGAWGVPAAAFGAGLYVVLLRGALPQNWELVQRMVEPLLRAYPG
jgi:peptidoglycan biosynthesis protein MviN/MurJ (putative lipid II flippase)